MKSTATCVEIPEYFSQNTLETLTKQNTFLHDFFSRRKYLADNNSFPSCCSTLHCNICLMFNPFGQNKPLVDLSDLLQRLSYEKYLTGDNVAWSSSPRSWLRACTIIPKGVMINIEQMLDMRRQTLKLCLAAILLNGC